MTLWQVAFLICLWGVSAHGADWSHTTPQINLTHIFEGEINKRGKPVGFHARPQGRDPENAHLSRMIAGPNEHGVYTGSVEIYDPREGRWKVKSFSSFFPDRFTRDEIQKLILIAFQNAKPNKAGKWRARSGLGFQVEGWLCPKGGTDTCPDGAINTAYPLYQKDR
ncbi:MAG: EndoU domain-containing protein [Methylocystaceae bacterium]|nr:EndoU domain-containing protein [Methylocystaceae bacterium]